MKKCPYCGAEYPDDAAVCAVDGQALSDPAEERRGVTGVWRGAYGYDAPEQRQVVPFTLRLKQGWTSHFTGVVTEDEPLGTPGTGTIDGYFDFPRIEFNKQMPVGFTILPDGRLITLREKLIADGHTCERELPSPVIFYEGTFLDDRRVQGTWIIRPTYLSIPGGGRLPVPETTGLWCAEFISADRKAPATGGPREPFYDRSRLPQPETTPEATTAGDSGFHSMGKFSVMDAEKFLKKFEVEKLRFEINRDDAAIRQMTPFTAAMGGYSGTAQLIEIFIHPEDEARAVEIMGEN